MKKIFWLALSPFTGLFAQNLQISGGNNFSAAVCDNQIVFAWGSNANGQLGIDSTNTPYTVASSNKPLPVGKGILPKIRQIDAGSGAHILGLDCNKQVWAWGENNCGQIGKGGAVSGSCGTSTTVKSPLPTRVLRGDQPSKVDAVNDPSGIYLHNIFYVSGGNNSSYAIEETTGRVYAWGQNTNGQLGDGTTVSSSDPVLVIKQDGTPLTGIIQIEGGDKCAYALDNAGNVWSWGKNDGAELGRTAANGTAAAYRAGQVQIDANFDNTPDGILSGITQISGGDTHGLGLGSDGSVWSWGGDWGPGQRGLGPGYQGYTGFVTAYKVLAPGITTATDQTYKTGPYLTGASYVAAGQASSAVVLATGEVVTFGGQGFFTGNSTDFPCVDSDETAKPQYTLQSGALGNCGQANGTCTAFTANDNDISNANGWSLPTYVKTNASTRLTNIVSVSDGDAWYFAVDKNGNAFAWGWNRRGELGTGTNTDAACAISFPLPTGCKFSYDCPGQPKLPANYQTCPIFSDILDSQTPKTYPSYEYTWYTRPVGGGAWSVISGSTNATYTASAIGQYKVVVSDNRGPVSFLCSPCPALADSIIISEKPNPYTSSACYDHANNKGQFTITAPLNSKIKWYSTLTLGTPLNPSDSNSTITTTAATIVPSCGSGKYGLFAEDLSSIQGTLFPSGSLTPSVAQIATGTGCASALWRNNAGNGALLSIRPTRTVKITSVSLYLNNNSGNTVNINGATNVVGIYTTSAASASPTGLGGPATVPINTSLNANTSKVISIPVNWTLSAGTTYWIRANGDYNYQPTFSCNITSPINDNTGQSILQATGGFDAQTGNATGRGSVFDIKFETGSGYTCGRILVCESSTCTLPINFIYFTGHKIGSNIKLNWGTASENDTKSFKIQKSYDGISFTTISEIKNIGQSYNEYEYIDHLEGKNNFAYYKIIEINNLNSSNSESQIIMVNLSTYNSNVSVAPNPNNGSFKISLTNEVEKMNVHLVDLTGKTVLNQTGSGNTLNINLDGSTKGTYLLYINGDDENWIEKIVIE